MTTKARAGGRDRRKRMRGMVSTVVVLVLTAAAAWTDATRRRIYNWTTYPGMALGIACQGIDGGWSGVQDALWGLLACGGIMVACFVFFRDLGGGDVKLLAMIGAGLGLSDGILAMLWTFVIGFVAGLAWLIWKEGAMQLLRRILATISEAIVMHGRVTPQPEESSPLNRWLYLGPAALVAVVVVRWSLLTSMGSLAATS